MGRSWWGAVLVVYLLAGCAPMRTMPPAPPPVIDGVQLGVASWYGPGFHGNRTANGEIYDQYELTAAHRTLPLGTRVMVTNLSNGRAVEVRINDRGPFVGGRAIDLSYAAACVLHVVGPGTARVRIEVLPPATQVAELTGAPPQPPPVRYLVQVAALADPARSPPSPSRPPTSPRGSVATSICPIRETTSSASRPSTSGSACCPPAPHCAPRSRISTGDRSPPSTTRGRSSSCSRPRRSGRAGPQSDSCRCSPAVTSSASCSSRTS